MADRYGDGKDEATIVGLARTGAAPARRRSAARSPDEAGAVLRRLRCAAGRVSSSRSSLTTADAMNRPLSRASVDLLPVSTVADLTTEDFSPSAATPIGCRPAAPVGHVAPGQAALGSGRRGGGRTEWSPTDAPHAALRGVDSSCTPTAAFEWSPRPCRWRSRCSPQGSRRGGPASQHIAAQPYVDAVIEPGRGSLVRARRGPEATTAEHRLDRLARIDLPE